ncbi:uncharacterized protein LOC130206579 isoform X2 [Pseudoliparis swirei]|uniref:uncharacterized protein LOC130206579 isoform X2 n=1 Tax=Pseudoliparis swirei TaxID=2059687 RepID=UPI0024BE34EF|nr:uncharacterized protein LOC130206579 isoform X2 [Pseudoliparis swirei]
METDMLGPFTITGISEKVVHLAKDQSTTVANIDQLTPFNEPEDRIPAGLTKVSSCPILDPPPQQPPPSLSSPNQHAAKPPPAASEGNQPIHAIQDIWQTKGHILWSKLGPYKLFTTDLQNLAPGRELESEIINAYLLWVTRKIKSKVKVIDSFEMTAIWDGTSRGLRQLDVMEWDTLIGAVCKDHHWTLVAMYSKEGRVMFIDPFGATLKQLKHCRDATRAFMRKRNRNLSRWISHTVSHPPQQDSTSCGVLVCKIAELLLTEGNIDFAVDNVGVNILRAEMASRLVDDSDNLKDLCSVCGEEDSLERDTSEPSVDNWIECTLCRRWFHWVCVARPKMEEDYLCRLLTRFPPRWILCYEEYRCDWEVNSSPPWLSRHPWR